MLCKGSGRDIDLAPNFASGYCGNAPAPRTRAPPSGPSDALPRIVEAGTALIVGGANLSGQPSSRNLLRLRKPVPITGLEISGAKGEDMGSRGSGPPGATGRAVSGASNTEGLADAFIDITPENFSARPIEDGNRLLGLMVKALGVAAAN